MANDLEEIKLNYRRIAFREALDLAQPLILCSQIYKYRKKSESFAKKNLNNNLYECYCEKNENLIRIEVFSRESKDIIAQSVDKTKKPLR